MARGDRSAPRYNDDIEILRAYAVLLVLFEHLTSITASRSVEALRNYVNGWTGVDLFFAVSGFVIYRSLAASLHRGTPWPEAIGQIVVFWLHRFWRLAPAAWLWLLLGVPAILTYRTAEIGTAYDNIGDFIAAFLNIENLHRYDCNVRGQDCGRLFAPYWSLSLEVQFYLMLPFAMVLLRRRWLAAAMFLLVCLQFPLQRPANGVAIGWFLRTDAIAWGVLLGLFWESGLTRLAEPTFLRHPATRAVFTLVLIGLLGSSQILWREPFFVGLVALFSAGLVWAASYNEGYISRLFGAGAVLSWIGTRSYSLYVAHMVIFKAARQMLQYGGVHDAMLGGKVIYLAASYGTTFVCAALTYRLVEQPLRRLGRGYAADYLIVARSTAQHAGHATQLPRQIVSNDVK